MSGDITTKDEIGFVLTAIGCILEAGSVLSDWSLEIEGCDILAYIGFGTGIIGVATFIEGYRYELDHGHTDNNKEALAVAADFGIDLGLWWVSE